MAPLAFVIFQLLVLGWIFIRRVWQGASRIYRAVWLASLGGVVGFDVWYLASFAYPGGFHL